MDTITYIVLDMTPVVSIDYTAAHLLQDIIREFRTVGIELAFAAVSKQVLPA